MVKLLKILHEKLLISLYLFFKGKALKIMLSFTKSNLCYILKLYIKENVLGKTIIDSMLPWKSLLCLNCTSALNSLFNMFISLSTSLQQIYHVKIDLRGNKARKYEVYRF